MTPPRDTGNNWKKMDSILEMFINRAQHVYSKDSH